MPRLSQADAELVVRCLERVLEGGKVTRPSKTHAPSRKSSHASRPVSNRLAPLPVRVRGARGALRAPPTLQAGRRAMVHRARGRTTHAPRAPL